MYVLSPHTSLLAPHSSFLTCPLCQFDLSCSALASTAFSLWRWRSDSARAGCSVVFGYSTNQRLASGEGGPGHPRCVPSTRPVKRDGTTGLVWLGLPNSNATATMIQEPEAESLSLRGVAARGLYASRQRKSVGPIRCRQTRALFPWPRCRVS